MKCRIWQILGRTHAIILVISSNFSNHLNLVIYTNLPKLLPQINVIFFFIYQQ